MRYVYDDSHDHPNDRPSSHGERLKLESAQREEHKQPPPPPLTKAELQSIVEWQEQNPGP